MQTRRILIQKARGKNNCYFLFALLEDSCHLHVGTCYDSKSDVKSSSKKMSGKAIPLHSLFGIRN